jgi:MFS family permease
VLIGAIVLYVVATVSATQLPPVTGVVHTATGTRRRYKLPRDIRLARFATAGVRFLNGYLVLLVAFSLREGDSSVASLAILLAAAGLGYFLSAWAAPTIGRHVREEPMVVGALAVMAIAAFIGAQVLSLAAASVLVGAAGFAWGTAKFAFDAMMHRTVPEEDRARAFTTSETMFQIAWVVGALIPVLPFWPTELGLSSAGVVALVIQVAYVSLVLLPDHRDPPLVIDVRPPAATPVHGEHERIRPGVLDLI